MLAILAMIYAELLDLWRQQRGLSYRPRRYRAASQPFAAHPVGTNLVWPFA